jgi:hypothetical protein
MRKTIFLSLPAFLLFSLLSAKAHAQGNLQFNAVKYYQLSVTQPVSGNYQESSQTITVPSGKVWKIESALGSAYIPGTNQTTITSAPVILLDGRVLFQTNLGTSVLTITNPSVPFWLPAGSYTLTIKSPNSNATTAQFLGSVSILEFNVVP